MPFLIVGLFALDDVSTPLSGGRVIETIIPGQDTMHGRESMRSFRRGQGSPGPPCRRGPLEKVKFLVVFSVEGPSFRGLDFPCGAPGDHICAVELTILLSHIDDSIVDDQNRFHVDSRKWKPLIMSFCDYYGLGGNLHDSRLAKVF